MALLEQSPFIGERATRQRATPTDRSRSVATFVAQLVLPPTTLVVQDAVHNHVAQQAPEHYLTNSVGRASTADPGPLTLPLSFVCKVRGPLNVDPTWGTAIATRFPSGVNNSWAFSRYGGQGSGGSTIGGGVGVTRFQTGVTWVVANTSPVRKLPEYLGFTWAADGSYKGFTSPDGVTWTQTFTTSGSVPTLIDVPGPLYIGDNDGAGTALLDWDDRIFWVEYRTGNDGTSPANGTLAWRFDAEEHVSGTTWVDARSRTWTLSTASAVTHDPGSSVVTLIEEPAFNLVVQNAQHNFVVQDMSAWLAPSVSRATTPDPGPPPNTGFVVVIKARGPQVTGGTNGCSVSQNRGDPQRSWRVYRRGDNLITLTSYPLGTVSGAVTVLSSSALAIDRINVEYWAISHNAGTGAWQLLNSPDGVATYTVRASGTIAATTYFDSTDIMTIGADSTGGSAIWDDRIWWVEMRTGNDPLAGTLLWRFDANEHVSGTGWTDARGNVWTLTSAAALVHPVTDTPTITQSIRFDETARSVTIAATVTSTSLLERNELTLTTTAAATVTSTDLLHRKELTLPATTAAATIASTDIFEHYDLALTTTAAATVTSTAILHRGELALTTTAAATVTSTDKASRKELALATTAAATVAMVTDKATDREPISAITAAATVTSTDKAGRKELALATTAAATVTSTDKAGRKELALTTTVAATVATPTDRAGRKELALAVSAAATITSTDTLTAGAPPFTSATDDFNRANGAPGANWILDDPFNYSIVGNKLQRRGDLSSIQTIEFAQPASSSDHYAQAQYYGFATGFGGLVVRMSDSAGGYGHDGYYAVYNNGISAWSIWKLGVGSTPVVEGAPEAAPADGTLVRLEVSGSAVPQVRLYVDGALKLQQNDTGLGGPPITSGTGVGFFVDTFDALRSFDNFAAGVLAVPTLFSEDWNTADDTHWDFLKWPHQRPYDTIVGGKGYMAVGGGPTQVYADQYVSDFEMTVKQTWPSSIGGQYPEIAWRIYSGMASAVGSGYVIQVNGSGNGIDLFRVGGYTSIGNAADASLFAAGTRWFKIRVVGHNHKVKWWDEASAEPGTWNIDVTDASPPTDTSGVVVTGGGIGFRYYGATQIWYDDLTVTNLGPDLGPDGSMRMLSNAKVMACAGNNNAFGLDSDLTWCCWVKTTSYAGGIGTAVISLFDNVGGYCITAVGTNGVLQQLMSTGDFTTGYSFPLNTWVFVAMSRSITGGTDVYYAPQGTPTLTKTHNASIGVITSNPLRLLSDEFGGGPYSMGAAFKVWKAALSQAELTTEMTYLSAQRTTNLFASYPMRNGLDYRSENPVDNSLNLIYETGAIVSGPKSPAVDVSGNNYVETGRAVSVTATVTATDLVHRRELTLTATAAATVTLTDRAFFRNPIALTAAATVTNAVDQVDFKEATSALVVAATVAAPVVKASLRDLALTTTITATVTNTDKAKRLETALTATAAATVTLTDRASYHDAALVTAAATVTSTDSTKRLEPGLTTTISAAVTNTNLAHFRETALTTTITAGVTSVDLQTSPGHYDETQRQVIATATVALPVDQTDYDQLALTIIGGAVVTSTETAHRRDLGLTTTAAATVTSTDAKVFHYDETQRAVTAAATVTSTDRAFFHDLPSVTIAATPSTADSAHYKQLGLTVSAAATVTAADAAHRQESLSVFSVAIISSADRANFRQQASVDAFTTVTSLDSLAAIAILAVILITATVMSTDAKSRAGVVKLNDADAVFLGSKVVSRIYQGTVQVWP